MPNPNFIGPLPNVSFDVPKVILDLAESNRKSINCKLQILSTTNVVLFEFDFIVDSNDILNQVIARAEQIINIKWTPKKDFRRSDNMIYRATTTYNGLPYYQAAYHLQELLIAKHKNIVRARIIQLIMEITDLW